MTIHDVSDAELAGLAASGERSAAGELLARRLPMLAAMARRITLPTIDADDLLSEAITHLLHQWAVGEGPQSGIDAYLIRSMKNRVIDEIRSPRSRTTTIELIPEPTEPEPVGYHRAELHREFGIVRAAFERLPADQRRVLQAAVVDGRKPGDLVDEFGRPAGAIYALLHRAKTSLQRSVLQTILLESEEVACKKCARRLPRVIDPSLPDDPSGLSARHIRECEHCAAGWKRYLLLMSCGGVACFLVVGALVVIPVAPAVAAEPSQAPDAGIRTPGASTTRRGLGLVAVVAGAALAVWGVAHGLTAQKPDASLSMSLASPSAGTTNVTIAFDVSQSSWSIDDVTFVLPPGESLVSAPPGWSCRSTSSVELSCSVDGPNPRGGTLTFAGTGTGDATYRLVIHATSGRTPITATAEGPFPR